MLRSLLLAAAALLSLSACTQPTRPPGDIGVCYQVQPQRDGSLKYFKLVANDVPRIDLPSKIVLRLVVMRHARIERIFQNVVSSSV